MKLVESIAPFVEIIIKIVIDIKEFMAVVILTIAFFSFSF